MNESWLDRVRWTPEGLVPVIVQEAGSSKVLMFAWMNRESLARTVECGEAVYWSRSRERLWHKGESSGNVQAIRDIRLDCDADVLLIEVEQSGGIACHTGRHSCFFRKLQAQEWIVTDPVLKDPHEIYPAEASAGPAPVPKTKAERETGAGGDAQRADAEGLPLERDPATRSDERAAASVEILDRLASVLETRKKEDPESSYVARLYAKGLDAILKKVGEEATEVLLAAKDGDPGHLIRETADLWFHTLVMLAHRGLTPDAVLQELRRRFGVSGLDEKASRRPIQGV